MWRSGSITLMWRMWRAGVDSMYKRVRWMDGIDEVNLRRGRLLLGWVIVSGSNSRCRIFISLCRPNHMQPLKSNSSFHSSGVGKWGSASAGKEKAGMVHSVSGWTRGVQVKLWDPLRTRAIPERLRGVFTTRRHTNPRLPLPYVIKYMYFYGAKKHTVAMYRGQLIPKQVSFELSTADVLVR